MMKNNRFKSNRAALMGLMVLGFAFAGSQTASAATLTAFVEDQQCQGGDFVQVTLSATLNPPRNVQYTWDLNGDGIFDTAPSSNPTVTTTYPDEVNVTAVVKVMKGSRSFTDPVTFQTLRCGG
ncbi:MAG: PKD domain-containing protein [Chthoniobacterales bacterium]